MPRLRLALAIFAVALAGSSGTASADGVCPMGTVGPEPYGTCEYTGTGTCERCHYQCADGETYIWNMCNET